MLYHFAQTLGIKRSKYRAAEHKYGISADTDRPDFQQQSPAIQRDNYIPIDLLQYDTAILVVPAANMKYLATVVFTVFRYVTNNASRGVIY